MSRIWCVYEVFCTVDTKSELDVIIIEQDKILELRDSIDEDLLYSQMCDELTNIDVRNEKCAIQTIANESFSRLKTVQGSCLATTLLHPL